MIDLPGQRLRVAVRSGRPGGVPLLLMNGIGARLETFEPLLEVLDPDLEVIRFDAPGIGGSSLPDRPYRFSTLSRTLGRLVQHLGHDQVDVLGISWGGGLAQQFAFTERRRCRRLVLVATGAGALMVPGSPSVLMKMVTPRRYRDRDYLTQIAPDLYGGSVRRGAARLQDLANHLEGGGQRRAYAQQLLCGVGWTSVPFLPLLTQRVLVLAGDDDPIIPTVNGRMLASLARHGELSIYPGGHVELVANPSLLAPRIEEFLART
jgi:poly(3-hydroxyalkanoate) depolymerase